jgi:ABC-2 type transport system permease protein
VATVLPSGALAEGLHTALLDGRFPGMHPLLVLLGWAAVAATVAARTVRLR